MKRTGKTLMILSNNHDSEHKMNMYTHLDLKTKLR